MKKYLGLFQEMKYANIYYNIYIIYNIKHSVAFYMVSSTCNNEIFACYGNIDIIWSCLMKRSGIALLCMH